MYICICKNVTDGQIRRCIRESGASSLRSLRRELGAFDQCGKCAPEARQILSECAAEARPHQGQLRSAA